MRSMVFFPGLVHASEPLHLARHWRPRVSQGRGTGSPNAVFDGAATIASNPIFAWDVRYAGGGIFTGFEGTPPERSAMRTGP